MEPSGQRIEIRTNQNMTCVWVCVCVVGGGAFWGLYLAQISIEMWKSSLSWWPAGSSSSMGARRFRLSSERLSARLRERGGRCPEEDKDEDCVCRSWTGSFRSTLS